MINNKARVLLSLFSKSYSSINFWRDFFQSDERPFTMRKDAFHVELISRLVRLNKSCSFWGEVPTLIIIYNILYDISGVIFRYFISLSDYFGGWVIRLFQILLLVYRLNSFHESKAIFFHERSYIFIFSKTFLYAPFFWHVVNHKLYDMNMVMVSVVFILISVFWRSKKTLIK